MRLIWPAVAAMFLSTVALAGQPVPEPLSWDALPDPGAQVYEDPFLELTSDNINALSRVVQMQERIARDGVSAADLEASEVSLSKALASLSEEGVDAYWLISQRWIVKELRETAAAAGNTALDGRFVSIGGFAIPAPPADDGTLIAYLVPVVGMCSHMPPPDPNQLIRLRLSGNWSPARINEPVKVTGRLHIVPTEQSFNVLDGAVAMVATWQLDVERAETSFAIGAELNSGNQWEDALRGKIRDESTATETK